MFGGRLSGRKDAEVGTGKTGGLEDEETEQQQQRGGFMDVVKDEVSWCER